MKRHKIKREKPEASGSYSREQEEHDLAYYIHDRVELMHQVFSALKAKDLKAMTPACIRHLSVDNIKELCTEELLGISSKRLCAILDGADPPTDTESSLSASPERLETISLDSISSDEEILSQASKKSKKKHRHRGKERDKSKKKKKSASPDESADKSRASRAGLTVLELLELQARARAIRAQLQQEQAAKQLTEAAESSQDAFSDDEVLVKEEPPEVLVISSDDEKPSIAELETEKQNTSTETEKTEDSQKVTKRINNLVITVPQSKPTRKIKLNRTKSNPAPAPDKASTNSEPAKSVANVEKNTNVEKTNNVATVASKAAEKDAKTKEKLKKKQKKKDKKKEVDKDGSDQDEIMLQLSDSEKLDLLEDLGHKNYDNVSSQSSEDTESSSSSSSESDDDGDEENGEDSQDKSKTKENKEEKIDEKKIIEEQNLIVDQNDFVEKNKVKKANVKPTDVNNSGEKTSEVEVNSDEISSKDKEILEAKCEVEIEKVVHHSSKDKEDSATITIVEEETPSDHSDKIEKDTEVEKIQEVEKSTITDRQVTEVISKEGEKSSSSTEQIQDTNETIQDTNETIQDTNETVQTIADCEISEVPKAENNETSTDKNLPSETCEESTSVTPKDKNDEHKPMSDGELSDQGSSEVEATELQPEVVCISDDEKKSKKSKKKHKKKEKKNKKEKKSKKEKSDFRNGSDQNFYKDSETLNHTEGSNSIDNNVSEPIVIDEDDIYEILELSDDSSCYEVEGTVLSKEPTAEEIEALSAKIDEIERIEVITDEEIRQHEQSLAEKNETDEKLDDIEQISWKDRYLGSKKVKKVLTTSNILNALRKKNKELKKKLEESKTKEREVEESDKVETPEKQTESNLEEGSIEQYNTLQGSTKYVDPVKEPENNTEDKQNENEENKEGVVTKEMKKDAKQLLKMYKRLLKYNDINKQKDPNKKKKKKLKKKSKDSESVASVVNNGV